MYNLKNSKQDEFFVRIDYFNQQNVFMRSGLQFQKIKQAKMFAKQQASNVDDYLSFTSYNFSLKNFDTLSEMILNKEKTLSNEPASFMSDVICFSPYLFLRL